MKIRSFAYFVSSLLVMRSRFLPRVLGVLLIIGAVAYVAHSITSLLMAGQRIVPYERVTMLARAAAEFPIMLWISIKGADVRTASSGAAEQRHAADAARRRG